MSIVKTNDNTIGLIKIDKSSLSVSMNDLITNTISISTVVLSYSQAITKTLIELKKDSSNMVYI